ncbi:hypothetical protein EYF80_064073 [Liparis tanakae]|uniref:Uncharacterized protein n=1 Tax=Liparis tanakae TaxID=230148 RepID=A0A4Z2EAC0_9TELE|nr:hypothetical protein EYF80_064073 [Liparis tanakae]
MATGSNHLLKPLTQRGGGRVRRGGRGGRGGRRGGRGGRRGGPPWGSVGVLLPDRPLEGSASLSDWMGSDEDALRREAARVRCGHAQLSAHSSRQRASSARAAGSIPKHSSFSPSLLLSFSPSLSFRLSNRALRSLVSRKETRALLPAGLSNRFPFVPAICTSGPALVAALGPRARPRPRSGSGLAGSA